MPNHYTNVLYLFPRGLADEAEIVKALVDREWGKRPLNRAVPMPAELDGGRSPAVPPRPDLVEKYGADNWYDWQVTHRGIKWDAYDVQPPIELPGDTGAVQLTFCTAWCPPNEATCEAVARELLNEYDAGRVVWVGLDPSNDTFRVVGQWEYVAPLRLVEA